MLQDLPAVLLCIVLRGLLIGILFSYVLFFNYLWM